MPKPSPEERALAHRKPCTLCQTPRDVLIRCQIDEAGKWHFVCPGKCWKTVSGGVIDGDLAVGHKNYRYGGMWKNKHAGVSAKVPKRLKGKMTRGAKKAQGAGAGAEMGGQSGDSDGSDGSYGSEGSRGSGVAIDDDEASEGNTTLVEAEGSKSSTHESERT